MKNRKRQNKQLPSHTNRNPRDNNSLILYRTAGEDEAVFMYLD
ncbi:hypothetical protein [Paenibacillus sp. CCS19]|nr:hypothetical protein [Paenibacillus cellulosilyticus]